MSVSLEQEIVALQDLHGSSRDPCGTAFVPLADAHRRAGEFDRALELLSEGLSRHPEYTSAHVVTSWVHMDRGAHDEALGTLELILELDHDNRAGLKGLGKLLNEKGDREGAIGHLARLVELEPEDLEASSLLETIQAFEPVEVHQAEPIPEISAEGPEAPDTDEEIVTRTMGEVYADQGLLYEAIEVYEQLAAAAPDDDEVMARLEELHAEAATPLVADDPPAAPEPISIDELAPAPEGERPVVSIGSLAPDGERPVVPIALLAPDDAYG